MGKIIKLVVGALFTSLFNKINEWITQQKLEQAKSEAEAAKSYVISLEEAENTEKEMEEAAKKVSTAYKEVNNYQEKLDALRKAAENRRIEKIKKDIGDSK